MEERAQGSDFLSSDQNTVFLTLGLSRSVCFSPRSLTLSLEHFVWIRALPASCFCLACVLKTPQQKQEGTKVEEHQTPPEMQNEDRTQDTMTIKPPITTSPDESAYLYRVLMGGVVLMTFLICLSQYLKRTLQAGAGVKRPQPCVT